MRVCSQCQQPDRELPGGEEPEHFVKPEIRWVADGMSPREKRRMEAAGWTLRVFQGRNAMERMMCVDCLRTNEERDKIWEGLRRDAKKLERQPAAAFGGYYQMLCEE